MYASFLFGRAGSVPGVLESSFVSTLRIMRVKYCWRLADQDIGDVILHATTREERLDKMIVVGLRLVPYLHAQVRGLHSIHTLSP